MDGVVTMPRGRLAALLDASFGHAVTRASVFAALVSSTYAFAVCAFLNMIS